MNNVDPDAARRQAAAKISSTLMTLTYLLEDASLSADHRQIVEDMHRDLTRARFLLVEHEDPDGILDELAQI